VRQAPGGRRYRGVRREKKRERDPPNADKTLHPWPLPPRDTRLDPPRRTWVKVNPVVEQPESSQLATFFPRQPRWLSPLGLFLKSRGFSLPFLKTLTKLPETLKVLSTGWRENFTSVPSGREPLTYSW
jgi:hypothetical protein